MNRTELIGAVAEASHLEETVVGRALDGLQDVLLTVVGDGGEVRWTGLFTLDVTERAARTGRNPQTGEALEIAAGPQVRLRPGTQLRAAARR